MQREGLLKWWNPSATPAMSKLAEGVKSGDEEQKSASAVERCKEGWDEDNKVVYWCSISVEMSRPVAWVMW